MLKNILQEFLKLNSNPLLVGMSSETIFVENSTESSVNLKLSFHMAKLFTFGYLSPGLKTSFKKTICTPLFIAAMSILAKVQNQHRYLTTEE